ncbi:MAG: hypothetical protein JW940_38310 [Polyangiaceae bacterium]|nr:hypothetical protein [Polyangiaceae bacterium]
MHPPILRCAALVTVLAAAVVPGQGCDASERRIDLLPRAAEALGCGDGDCAVPSPYCYTGSHECVECLTDTNCGNEICASATHTCQQCQSSEDCAGPKPYCLDGACVECTAAGDCTKPDKTCDPIDHKRVPVCGANGDCTESKRPFCWAAQNVCVECLGDEDCASAKPLCVDYRCRECGSDEDCADPEPHCLASNHECKACLDDSECEEGLRCYKNDCKP